MPVPTPRAVMLLALGAALPLGLGGGLGTALALLAFDVAVVALLLLDARLAPGPAAFGAKRRVPRPLTAFAPNPIEVTVTARGARAALVRLADAPPPEADSDGHRASLRLAPGASGALAYRLTPRRRGRHAFGDLHLRVGGPLGLAWRTVRLPLAETASAYPDLAPALAAGAAATAEAGRSRRLGGREGREFAALRHYADGDDVRSIDWKATARRAAPVVREWQPERNQTLWLLLDCGRHLSGRLADGRTKLDRAVEASLALARAAAERGDRTGVILFGAEVTRVLPPAGGRGALGPLAEALHLAAASPVESDYRAALDALEARQRRRALVLLFTDLGDPDTCALLEARAALLRRRHLVLVAAISDSEVAEAARRRPGDEQAAFMRAAAERLEEEREAAAARLAAAGVPVTSVPADGLAAAVVGRYLAVKARGDL
ncbi:MAG: DUF58 domain-containing protein [Anaeromyxobacteraceae bacterium]|nr:DUF58 domain-containing protein [Anaeromyxobacteraceae bacterium]